ncbi:MAG: hypothetical protein J7501_13785, partial [Bdellovibrio sp.]|nr:hypothetical protein [Bdellovibrio sp.]
KHTYNLVGTWDTGINRGGIEGTYINQVTNLPFLLNAFTRSTYLGTVDNKLIDTGYLGAVLPDMYWLSRYASLQLGWQYFQRDVDQSANSDMKRTGPYAFLIYKNFNQSGAQISPESGKSAYLGLYNYIQKEDYLHHSQFTAGTTWFFSRFLPKHHALMMRLNGMYTPEKIPSIYGASVENVVFNQDNPYPQYILRGYKKGQLYGRNLAAFSAEYRFPVWNIYKGSGTDPYFLRRISGALTVDGAAADGVIVNDQAKFANQVYTATNMKKSYWSAGVEGRLDTTLGYIAPVAFILGVYQAFNDPAGAQTVIQTSIQITGLGF